MMKTLRLLILKGIAAKKPTLFAVFHQFLGHQGRISSCHVRVEASERVHTSPHQFASAGCRLWILPLDLNIIVDNVLESQWSF